MMVLMIVTVIAVPMIMVAMAVIVVVFLQEVRINIEFGVQVEASQVEHVLERYFAEVHRGDRCARVHVLEAVDQLLLFRFTHQIGLGQKNLIGKAHLAASLLPRIKLLVGMLGIHQRQDGVDEIALCNLIVHEKGLRHWTWIGEARSLNHYTVKFHHPLAALGGQQLQGFAQILANGAADAAVAHLQDLFLRLRLEDIGVDVLFAKLVFDHGNLHAMAFMQYAFEQRGFARAQKPGEDGDRNKRHTRPLMVMMRAVRSANRLRRTIDDRTK